MTVILVAILAGLALGSGCAGAVGWSLILTRSHRIVKNRFVIRLGQVVVLISMCGGLLLLQVLDEYMDIKRHSPPYYAAVYAYIFGCICVLFFALRAELRWRKSVGVDRDTLMSK
jgi:hypothetical protein